VNWFHPDIFFFNLSRPRWRLYGIPRKSYGEKFRKSFFSAGGQQDDALPSLRRRLDYIAANSITPSRGVADRGEYRQAARAASPSVMRAKF
jgi:hypothetical protein